jgi:3-deoxy-D-manno-octulosonic-acid transferase
MLPFLAVYLLWRSLKQPEYRQHWGERFAWTKPQVAPGALWIHAVSLGETLAAESLVLALRERYPERAILLTHTTPTGRAAGLRLAAKVKQLSVMYLPYDTPWAVRRFLGASKPSVGLLMETEVWPNLITCAKTQGIPLALINARLSEKSLARGQGYLALAQQALGALNMVLAQTKDDARRLALLGAINPRTLGNLKFDIQPSAELLALGAHWKKRFSRPQVLLLANTREGEEKMLLAALKAALDAPSNAAFIAANETANEAGAVQLNKGLLVLLVPRHPQRFDEVEQLILAEGFSYLRRSSFVGDDLFPSSTAASVQIVLGDSLGEMAAYYGAADVAVMGGSFAKLGGHNLIEACACQCPVILGPHMFNFALASKEAVASGAAWSVEDAQAAIQKALSLLADDRLALKEASIACADFAQQHRGATQRTLGALMPLLPPA